MSRLVAALRWETVVQARGQFYALTAVVAVVWIVLLRLFPAAWREIPVVLAPVFVFSNLQVTAFYFVTALVLLEKSEGALRALVVTPLRPGEYLAAKALTLMALGLIENVVIVLASFGAPPSWGWWVLSTAACGASLTLIGLALIAKYESISTFLMPSGLYVLFLSLPLFGYYSVVPMVTLAWHPLAPSLVLMRAAWEPVDPGWLAYGVLGSGVWLVVLGAWARRRFVHLIAPAQA